MRSIILEKQSDIDNTVKEYHPNRRETGCQSIDKNRLNNGNKNNGFPRKL